MMAGHGDYTMALWGARTPGHICSRAFLVHGFSLLTTHRNLIGNNYASRRVDMEINDRLVVRLLALKHPVPGSGR